LNNLIFRYVVAEQFEKCRQDGVQGCKKINFNFDEIATIYFRTTENESFGIQSGK